MTRTSHFANPAGESSDIRPPLLEIERYSRAPPGREANSVQGGQRMTRSMDSSDIFGFGASASCSRAARRARLNAQASRITQRATVAAATLAGISMIAPGHAWAQCIVGGVTVTCSTTTTTTDTTYPANAPNDRHYTGPRATPIIVNVDNGAAITGNGHAVTSTAGGVGAILNAGGSGNIDVSANGGIDARFGIDAENFGSGSTTVKTVGPVTVTTGNGIFALATGGDVKVFAD